MNKDLILPALLIVAVVVLAVAGVIDGDAALVALGLGAVAAPSPIKSLRK